MIIVRTIPVYWGLEVDAEDRTLVTRSTLYEVLPPYRESIWAFRIRVSRRRWLHLGLFRYDRDRPLRVAAGPNDIAYWGRRNGDAETPDAGEVQAGQVQPGGSDRPPGEPDDEVGRAVPGAVAL